MYPVKVYGADWCGDTQITCHQLDNLGVRYDYLNVDSDPAAKSWVQAHNSGKQKTPTLDVQGEILVEPDERQLEQTLRNQGLMA